jgi:hypothetical protein
MGAARFGGTRRRAETDGTLPKTDDSGELLLGSNGRGGPDYMAGFDRERGGAAGPSG